MASKLTVIHCKKSQKCCVTCGDILEPASMKGMFKCMARDCDSPLTAKFSMGLSVRLKYIERDACNYIAYPIGWAKSAEIFEGAKAMKMLDDTQIWYSDDFHVPLVNSSARPIGHKTLLDDRGEHLHYIYGTDRIISLHELPMVHCGHEIRDLRSDKMLTWPDYCQMEHKEPTISWKIGEAFANPERLLGTALTEKILQRIAEGESAFHIPPEEVSRTPLPERLPRGTSTKQGVLKQLCLLQSGSPSEPAIPVV